MTTGENTLKSLLPHQERVITELTELVYKADKLQEFIETNPLMLEISGYEAEDLKDQLRTMRHYQAILQRRITRFNF